MPPPKFAVVLVVISQSMIVAVLPDSGERYLSMMVINNDGYMNKVIYGGGSYHLTVDEFDTPYVAVVIRILVNDRDPADVAVVNKLQDKYRVEAKSSKPFVMPNYARNLFLLAGPGFQRRNIHE